MISERLSGLALMNMNHDMEIDLERVCQMFIDRNKRRMLSSYIFSGGARWGSRGPCPPTVGEGWPPSGSLNRYDNVCSLRGRLVAPTVYLFLLSRGQFL
ncbi:hypothetical protein HOLleu_38668 [Holothuria leucospilota]|uniref:Uncharacterized protein n=1 Tax=Holothuria leucospilota TaxID=206669 RepID=A0A9Q0YEN7_HOLLE|nr:hypothetical protein HOLleu_38668 [Holothuria leucospilota]